MFFPLYYVISARGFTLASFLNSDSPYFKCSTVKFRGLELFLHKDKDIIYLQSETICKVEKLFIKMSGPIYWGVIRETAITRGLGLLMGIAKWKDAEWGCVRWDSEVGQVRCLPPLRLPIHHCPSPLIHRRTQDIQLRCLWPQNNGASRSGATNLESVRLCGIFRENSGSPKVGQGEVTSLFLLIANSDSAFHSIVHVGKPQ